MAVNQAEADKEIRSQLVSTLESGHNHMALADQSVPQVGDQFASAQGSLQLLASGRAHTPGAKGHARLYDEHVVRGAPLSAGLLAGEEHPSDVSPVAAVSRAVPHRSGRRHRARPGSDPRSLRDGAQQCRQAHLLSVLSRRRRSQLLPHRGIGDRTPGGRTVAEREKGLATSAVMHGSALRGGAARWCTIARVRGAGGSGRWCAASRDHGGRRPRRRGDSVGGRRV